MVTVVKTITEHTNGRRLNVETGRWERRAGTREVPNSVMPGAKRRRPRMETVWEEAPAPKTYLYGSTEHRAARESGMGGGVVKWEISGVEEDAYYLDEEEATLLLKHYVKEFEALCWQANTGGSYSGRDNLPPHEAAQQALAIAKRVQSLFHIDLYETNAGAQ